MNQIACIYGELENARILNWDSWVPGGLVEVQRSHRKLASHDESQIEQEIEVLMEEGWKLKGRSANGSLQVADLWRHKKYPELT